MNDRTEQQLLRDFAERRSEAAFTELVRRYVELVHSAAFRMTGETHSAQDVTQAVFVTLAQNAARLTQHPVLSGWLHTTARNLAAKNVRATVHRQNHEQEAAAMNELLSAAPDASWEEIAPHLDAALGELSEPDRDAVLLRYFEKKSAAEIAARLGTSAEAAQKRVSRGVERLREIFTKRGVSVGASGLAVVISANAVQAAPGGLVLSISTAAVSTAAISTSTAIATTQPILMTALQKTLITATIAVVAGTAIFQATQNFRLRDEIETLRQRQTALASASNSNDVSALQNQIEQLSKQNAELTARLANANARSTQLGAAKQQAERSASLYRQLADQATAKSTSSTNDYPTQRHVFVGFGKLVRQMADLNNQDQSQFSAEEKATNNQMKASLLRDFMSLATLAGQYEDTGKTADNPASPESADNAADTMTCLLYGAIGLSEQQYGDIYNVLQKYQRQAAEQNLFGDTAGPDATSTLKQMNDEARKQIEPMLTGDQAKALEEIIPSIQLVTRKLNITFGSK